MKRFFSKPFLLAGAAILAWNCSDSSSPSTDEEALPPIVCSDAWVIQAGNTSYVIYPDMVVTDAQGTTIGQLVLNDDQVSHSIKDAEGKTIVESIDLSAIPVTVANWPTYKVRGEAWHAYDLTGDYIIYSTGDVYDGFDNLIGTADFTDPSATVIYINNVPVTTVNLTTAHIFNKGDKCTEGVATGPESSSSVPTSSVGGDPGDQSSSSDGDTSSNSTPKSSSSAKSSSSVVKSSSSVGGSCPTIKTKSGGRTGSGWATRYWDCCKPHCSWPEHAGGNYSRQCTNKGKSQNSNWSDGSICSGGSQMTCTSQIPFNVSGCDEMGFAFAAVPAADGGSCGKCYQLTFTGKGKYGDNINISSIKGKKLIIMVTNIGHDVEQGQFDIMIPGGGVGAFNGCASMGWGGQGEQYGGLLSDCERESDYKASATQTCLKNKCNSVFSNDAEAKKGCLFLAEWMHAAGNPLHNYVEVECPQVLKDKY
ncbi:hypothetical protein [Fibrobacter sp. UWP2]|uniref:hypothetical protein n=1 Tax=Fibrobacter sp. UWP2 TaxID=1896216 RepID=UPI00091626A6|nr:hypothetical protein [Fibrobacter sp. UWP2]SHI90416.1 Glycosyl hydrolase family 45 [Fibrobacter sp. UWP2]